MYKENLMYFQGIITLIFNRIIFPFPFLTIVVKETTQLLEMEI